MVRGNDPPRRMFERRERGQGEQDGLRGRRGGVGGSRGREEGEMVSQRREKVRGK